MRIVKLFASMRHEDGFTSCLEILDRRVEDIRSLHESDSHMGLLAGRLAKILISNRRFLHGAVFDSTSLLIVKPELFIRAQYENTHFRKVLPANVANFGRLLTRNKLIPVYQSSEGYEHGYTCESDKTRSRSTCCSQHVRSSWGRVSLQA